MWKSLSYRTKKTSNKYKSSFERGIAINLTKRGIPFEYESISLKYYLKPKGKKGKCHECGSTQISIEHTYIPDFIIGNLVIEAKGYFDSKTRSKMISVKKANPTLDIRMLFMFDNWVTKLKKQRYSDWCNKNGFVYAIMVVPDEWLKYYRIPCRIFNWLCAFMIELFRLHACDIV